MGHHRMAHGRRHTTFTTTQWCEEAGKKKCHKSEAMELARCGRQTASMPSVGLEVQAPKICDTVLSAGLAYLIPRIAS